MKTELMEIGEWNGCTIQSRGCDGYVNATQMCKANGKSWGNFHRLDESQRLIDLLVGGASDVNSPPVVEVHQGPNEGRGTWVCEELALALAAWISTPFHLWTLRQIRKLLRDGSVSVQKEHSEFMLVANKIGQLTDAVMQFHENFGNLSLDHFKLKSDVADIRSDVRGMRDDISSVKSAIDSRRKPFGTWVHESCAVVVVQRFACKCPICELRVIASEPWRRLAEWEVHHWRLKGGCSSEIAMPMCRPCHKSLHRHAWKHDEFESTFQFFQRVAAAHFASNNPNK